MKIRLLYSLFLATLCIVVLQSNRNGRATVGLEGVTGAPGDTSQGGNSKTCAVNGCHSTGAFGPLGLSIALLDSTTQTPVNQYIPGRNYIARVTISSGSGSPKGYGFQMIALRDNGNVPTNSFSDPLGLSNNYKLKTLGTRMYAEHQTMSTTNTFNVVWKAPVAGSGSVTFYSSGNAVNNDMNNSGDGATNNKLQVSELTSGLNDPRSAALLPLRLSPNPVTASTQLSFSLPESSQCRLLVRDLNGRIVWENTAWQSAGDNSVELPASSWQSGIYLIEISTETHAGAAKMLKM